MIIKPIKTETDYRTSLKKLDVIFDAKIGTKESDEADILGSMIDDYPIEAPGLAMHADFRSNSLSFYY